MANPELRRFRDLDSQWVEYAQGLLVAHLRGRAAQGEVEVSAVDGDFGPITEASAQFFQRLSNLDDDGIIGPDTWAALEATAPDTPEAVQADEPAQAEPIDLRLPFQLHLNWDELRSEDILREFTDLRLDAHPGAQLTFPEPVGKLFGNGGYTWLQMEFNNNPQLYLELSTRAIIGWSASQGLELGADNELEAGIRFRAVDLFVTGDLDVRLHPMVPSGSISGGGMLNFRFRFGEIGR